VQDLVDLYRDEVWRPITMRVCGRPTSGRRCP
jgi:hypothetical protein